MNVVQANGNANHPARVRRLALLIGAVAFISCAYFYEGGGWNQNSRFDLVRAIVQQHTLSIDAYHENTQDKAFANGHYYSDKAPGVVLLAVPVALAARPVLRAAGVDPDSSRGLVAISYFATVIAISLPFAAACACLFLIALRLGASIPAAAFAACSMALATPLWAYATLFWGHALAGACLLLAFAAALQLSASVSGRPNAAGDFAWSAAAGLAAGWATVTEYPAAPASLILALFALALVWKDGWLRRWRVAAGIAAGALPCVAVLLIYQRAAFGSAFHPSYSYYPTGAFPWMKHGYLGLTYPHIGLLFRLLFSYRRGLLLSGPVLFAAPFGLRWLAKQPATRAAAITASAIAAYYLLFQASFSSYSGWSYGPRYLSPGLPLLCLGLAPAWDRARKPWRIVIASLAAAGLLFTLMTVATTSQPPSNLKFPMLQLTVPSFSSGNLSINPGSMLTAAESGPAHIGYAFNLGELLGLHGLTSLLPLLACWLIAALALRRMARVIKSHCHSEPAQP
jgi:hypothetical protein